MVLTKTITAYTCLKYCYWEIMLLEYVKKKSSFEFSLISNQENAKNKLFESSKIIYKSKLRILLNYFLDHLILIFIPITTAMIYY